MNQLKFKYLPLLTLLFSLPLGLNAQNENKPKLVVQIVISQMRYDYLDRFYDNFTDGGFRALIHQGANYTNAHYNYMLTNTAAGLATLTTGANPSEHGVIGEDWVDFTTGNKVNLIEDYSVRGLDCDDGVGCYSPRHLTASTLGDQLKESDSLSKVISIATSAASAIVSGGSLADVYWMDAGRGDWISSSFYFQTLPYWVKEYNKTKPHSIYMDRTWDPLLSRESYRNKEVSLITFENKDRVFGSNFLKKVGSFFHGDRTKSDVSSLQYTPYNNTLTTQFARETLIREQLGQDSHTDLLMICYDSPRFISERFGPRSIELEDMYYKLDAEISDLLQFIYSQNKPEDVIVLLTSDHGSSDNLQGQSRVPQGVFNADQFMMIINGFLGAQFEPGNWVTGYHNRQLYLNRDFIYSYGFSLAEVQARTAAFALQFQGISGALTSSSMQNGYFASGYAERMQNSFYPKRGGDVTITLMPGWIEERDNTVSMSGSLYEYDTHVPLIIKGGGIPSGRIDRNVSMTDVAPTLAQLLGIMVPNASTGVVLPEVAHTQNY